MAAKETLTTRVARTGEIVADADRLRQALALVIEAAIRISADAARVRWLLHGRSGYARPGTLHLRAPRSKGVFRLYVTAGKHAATAAVVVG